MRVRELTVAYRRKPGVSVPEFCRQLLSPSETARFVIPILARETSEVFGIICLSTKYEVLCWHEVARGSLSSCIVEAREVFKAAILANSACIILSHNHPSGRPEPSPEDMRLTKRLGDAGELVGIPVIDHVIVGCDDRYVSFKEMGVL